MIVFRQINLNVWRNVCRIVRNIIGLLVCLFERIYDWKCIKDTIEIINLCNIILFEQFFELSFLINCYTGMCQMRTLTVF